MSFPCEKCDKEFSTEQSMKRHQRKKLPCDLKCKTCNAPAFNSASTYYRHMQKEHDVAKKRTDNEVLDCSKLEKLDFSQQDKQQTVPLSDFRELYEWMVREARENDCEITFRQMFLTEIKIKASDNTDRERMRRVLETLQNSACLTSLQSLSKSSDLGRVAVEILDKVHASEDTPENHSICMADMSRKTTKFFTRSGDKCGWELQPKEAALQKLNSHSSDLLAILLKHAVEKLQDASFIRNYKKRLANNNVHPRHRMPCLCMTDGTEYVMLSLDSMSPLQFDEEEPLNVEYVSFDDLFSPGDIDPNTFADLRNKAMERRKDVLDQLKELLIDERHLIDFLRKSRPICLQTHQSLSALSLK